MTHALTTHSLWRATRAGLERLSFATRLALLVGAHGVLALWLWRQPQHGWASLALSIPITSLALGALPPTHHRLLRVLRGLVIAALYDTNLTFATYYGRFVSVSELRLLANNSLVELGASLALYFNWSAVLAAVALALLWDALIEFHPSPDTHQSESLFIGPRAAKKRGLAAALWLVSLLTLKLEFQPLALMDPMADYVATIAAYQLDRVLHRSPAPIVRAQAALPDAPPPPFDIIYIIGESFRADRFPPQPSARPVTPFLSHVALPHVYFSNVSSHGDCTGRSVPYLMVEPKAPLHRNLYRQPTLFQYAKAAGFETSFIYSNENDWNEFVTGAIDHLHRNRELNHATGDWLFNDDRAMLPTITAQLHEPKPQFIVIESYTSHWPYADRYRSCANCRVYRPDNQGEPMPFAERYRQPITNSYDNAILYFDHFFESVVHEIKKPTLVIFTSDHGESIGDQGRWGHCSQGPEQMKVPLMFIASTPEVATLARFGDLAAKQTLPLSHAQLFKTVLQFLGYTQTPIGLDYPPSVFEVPNDGVADRTVLVSEIGLGQDPVSIAHLNAHSEITQIVTEQPHETHP